MYLLKFTHMSTIQAGSEVMQVLILCFGVVVAIVAAGLVFALLDLIDR